MANQLGLQSVNRSFYILAMREFFGLAITVFVVISTALVGQAADHRHVQGQCTIKGAGNMVDSPCRYLLLILTNSAGKEVLRDRTDNNGNFNFAPKSGQESRFHITSGSRFYKVVSPTGLIKRGTKVNLQLKEK